MFMPRNGTLGWSFLTNHAQVLLCIAQDPGIRLREIGEAIGITERAAHRIVVELVIAGDGHGVVIRAVHLFVSSRSGATRTTSQARWQRSSVEMSHAPGSTCPRPSP